ncbi:hypothetical protein MNBD_GAMMA11-485 [hydrothermal vent metagenome]|uniref:Uncharacterized protein n=1 Tax=hydrothermal vent metagenome TaxID=652676 RepID=A0A3B0XG14_9ZZZZ
MNKQSEYAVLYTRQERTRQLMILVGVFLLLLGVAYFILLPEWTRFVASAHCKTILGMPGIAVMIYGVFTGIPAAGGIVLGLVFGWLGIKTVIEKQSPPASTKVFKKTRILRGREAVLKGVFLLLFVPTLFVPVVSWGYLLAGDIIAQYDVESLDYSMCVKQINNF